MANRSTHAINEHYHSYNYQTIETLTATPVIQDHQQPNTHNGLAYANLIITWVNPHAVLHMIRNENIVFVW